MFMAVRRASVPIQQVFYGTGRGSTCVARTPVRRILPKCLPEYFSGPCRFFTFRSQPRVRLFLSYCDSKAGRLTIMLKMKIC